MHKLFVSVLLITILPMAYGQDKQADIKVLCLEDQEFSEEENMLYTPAFRAAWTSLSRTILLEPVKLRKYLRLAEDLNNSPFIPSDKDHWYIKSGFIEKGIIKEIEKEVSLKFGIPAPVLTNPERKTRNSEPLREGILNYSLFNYKGNFKVPFEELIWDFESGSTKTSVRCFGVSKGSEEPKSGMRKQVSIYDYQHHNDFIVRIEGTADNYEIILAKTRPDKNVNLTVKEIDTRISESFPDHLGSADELIIPKIQVDTEEYYKELHNRFLANKGFREYFIAEAMQAIHFSLNQDGAKANVTGKLLLKKGPVPRIYAFDRPFFLLLREKGSSEPSLSMWIFDTTFLEEAE